MRIGTDWRAVSRNPDDARLNRRALVAAAIAGIVGFALLEVHERRLMKEISGGPPVSVLVATRDLPRGTELSRQLLGAHPVPESYVEPRQIREEQLDKILGGKLGVVLRAGEALEWTDLQDARARDRQLSDLVEPGTRALAIRATTFSGLIRPGDRVDVLERRGDSVTPALQNLVVLAVGPDTTDTRRTASESDVVTLGGTPEEIAELTRVTAGGQVALSLRNPDDVLKTAVDPRASDPGRLAAQGPARPKEIEHVR